MSKETKERIKQTICDLEVQKQTVKKEISELMFRVISKEALVASIENQIKNLREQYNFWE